MNSDLIALYAAADYLLEIGEMAEYYNVLEQIATLEKDEDNDEA